MKTNYLKVYHITPNYRKLIIWHCGRMTQSRHMMDEITPDKGLSRMERYRVIAKALGTESIPSPVYR